MRDVMLFYLLFIIIILFIINGKDFIEIFCLHQFDFINLFIYSGEPRA